MDLTPTMKLGHKQILSKDLNQRETQQKKHCLSSTKCEKGQPLLKNNVTLYKKRSQFFIKILNALLMRSRKFPIPVQLRVENYHPAFCSKNQEFPNERQFLKRS